MDVIKLNPDLTDEKESEIVQIQYLVRTMPRSKMRVPPMGPT